MFGGGNISTTEETGRSRDAVGAELGMSGKTYEMWMACYTQEEIAAAVDLSKEAISNKIELCQDLETFPKVDKLLATFQDEQFTMPHLLHDCVCFLLTHTWGGYVK